MEPGNKKKTITKFQHQPIICPWIPSQPYPSAPINKSKSSENTKNKAFQNKVWTKANSSEEAKFLNSTKSTTSTSHFFYFLRLMQLFPDTHPATLHTVLTLTKNNFFSAIDKLLYARKCKNAYYKSQCYYKISSRFHNGNPANFHHGKTVPLQPVQVQQQEYTNLEPTNSENQNEQQDQLNHQEVTLIGIERTGDSDEEEFKDQSSKTEIIQIRIENVDADEDTEMEQDSILSHTCQEVIIEEEDQLLNDVHDMITNSSEIIASKDDIIMAASTSEEVGHIDKDEAPQDVIAHDGKVIDIQ